MRIRSQLVVAAALAAATGLALLLGVVQVTRESAGALQEQSDAHDVASDIASLLTLTNEFAAHGGERAATQWSRRYAQLLATIDRPSRETGQTRAARAELRRQVEYLKPLFESLVRLPQDAGTAFEQRRRELLIERLLTEAQEVVEVRQRWATALLAQQAADQQRFTIIVVAAPAVLLLLLGALGVVAVVRVLLPLARLERSANAIADGSEGPPLETAARDEVGAMARAFAAMTLSLRQQREAREAADRHLRLVIDHVPALIGYIDRERRYAAVNQPYVSWHGAPNTAALLGRGLREFYSEQTFAVLGPQLERAFAGETVTFEAELEHRGSIYSMHITYVPELDAGGSVEGVYTMKSDVTALRRAQQRLQATMDASALGMLHTDAQAHAIYANPAWLQLTGRTLEQALGEAWVDAVHPDDRERVHARLQATRERREPQTGEYRYLRPDGRIVWVRATASPICEGERVVGVIGIVADITERRRLDAELAARTDELARSNAELEQFAYVASHDLQEPLRMVTSYTQLLRRRYGERFDGDAREFLDYVEDGGKRAQLLISDLLALARVNSRGRPFEPVALDAVLDEVMVTLKVPLLESAGRVERDPGLPCVSADRRQLAQLLQNLLANAIKFRGQRAPVVHVGARRTGDGHWRVEVRDNGIGIEPKFHQRVFQMFQRLHLRGEYPGTGIGLAICKKVVERHGGEIGVDSVPGGGSTFWFTIAAGGAA